MASNTNEIPNYKRIGPQRGCGFGVLVKVYGRNVTQFLRNYVVPAAKGVGDDLLEYAALEVAKGLSGNKNLKSAAKNVGRQTLRKQLGRVGKQKEAFQRKV